MRCDKITGWLTTISHVFQSTHLHEVWLCVRRIYYYWKSFNPHTYMRCDNSTGRSNRAKGGFNPHTYMRCDTNSDINAINVQGFNPHTYMRCDTHARDIQWCQAVSIHTPTWGVTLLSEVPDRIIRFQSTHLHEVWPRPLSGRWSGTSFNPHTYMRCDPVNTSAYTRIRVSIHTPTWGVTIWQNLGATDWRFQSTHLHEVWLIGLYILPNWMMFQSTHLHEVWLLLIFAL